MGGLGVWGDWGDWGDWGMEHVDEHNSNGFDHINRL
jgi:hypothetical protein